MELSTEEIVGCVEAPGCDWCGEPGRFILWRAWGSFEHEGIDVEVCDVCATGLQDHGLEIEPMTPADYRRHGIPAVDETEEVPA